MKKLSLLLLTLTVCFFTACHKDIWAELNDLNSRVTKLEELCKEMNTNITSLQTIVSVLQSNDYITGIIEIKKNGEVIGYTITFGKHDPITIYHGQDGKDGQDGSSSTPVIGVAQDTDGVYYWTLNGEWLLDDNGNKLPVSGTDGKDGQNGSNGQNGVTPQLKIEEGYWYISYDNGATWTELGRATGEDGQDGKDGADGTDGKDGQNGADGKDGQDGDSMFQSVTQDENYVYFILADGTVIKIAKGNGNSQSNDEFVFTITYDANGGTGTMSVDTVYYGYSTEIKACSFTREGYSFVEWNTDINGKGAPYQPNFKLSIDKNITLYAQWIDSPYECVDLGLSVKWATCNVGASKPEDYGDYFAWGETESKSTYTWSTYKWSNGTTNDIDEESLTKYYNRDKKTMLDKEDDAATANWGGIWRMPTDAESTELIENCTWTWTSQNGVYGYKVTSKKSGYTNKSIFLPSTGYYARNELCYIQNNGIRYWTSLMATYPITAHGLSYGYDPSLVYLYRHYGLCVRPVCP